MPNKIESLTDQQWQHAYTMRDEWLTHGLSTSPADRPTTERAITEMYRPLGRPQPQFVWVDSPATASLAIWLLSGKAGDSLRNSLDGSLRNSLDGSLRGSLGDSLGGSLRDSLAVSLRDSLGGSLGGSLAVSLRASLRNSLGGPLAVSLRASLRNSLGGPLGGSLAVSLRASLRNSLGDSLGDSLRGSLRNSLGDSLGDSLRGSLPDTCTYLWGQHDAHWVAYYDVPRRLGIVTYDSEDSRRLDLWADLVRSCGWWWPYENLCIVSERHSVVRTEPWPGRDAVRLHCADGPALRFRDGWTVHSWHGTRVPADLVMPGWNAKRVFAEENSEIRRCAVEKLAATDGWDRIVTEFGCSQVGDTMDDPGNPGRKLRLYRLEGVYDEPVGLLLMTNGTVERDGKRHQFGETVPASIGDPVAAAAWQIGISPANYRKTVRRT